MTPNEIVERAREKARVLYQGKQVAHRSCSLALAETFNVPSRPYEPLRRGGLTGEGRCGAVKAGELILGEIFGAPDPNGPMPPRLRDALAHYQAEIAERLERCDSPTLVCNDLTRRFPIFRSEERLSFCSDLVASVTELVAETILRFGGPLEVGPLPER